MSKLIDKMTKLYAVPTAWAVVDRENGDREIAVRPSRLEAREDAQAIVNATLRPPSSWVHCEGSRLKILDRSTGRCVHLEVTIKLKPTVFTLWKYYSEDTHPSDIPAGVCLSCGAEHWGVEPDAQAYECLECELPSVYGLEEIAHFII